MDFKPGDVIKLKNQRSNQGASFPGGVFTADVNGKEVKIYICPVNTSHISYDGKNVIITDPVLPVVAKSQKLAPLTKEASVIYSKATGAQVTPRSSGVRPALGSGEPPSVSTLFNHPRPLTDDEQHLLKIEIQNLRMELESLTSNLDLIRKYFCSSCEEGLDRSTLDLLKPKLSAEERLFEKMCVDPFVRKDTAGKAWAESVAVTGSVTVLFRSTDAEPSQVKKLVSKEVALEPSRKPFLRAILFPVFNLNAVEKSHLENLGSSKFNVLELVEQMGIEAEPEVHEHYLWLLIMHMFHNLDLVNTFKIPEHNLYRFVATICRRYRPVPFHNWFHAFNVTQTMYYFLTTLNCKHVLGPLEILSMLLATLCHDADHPGLNNMFQAKAQTQIASLHKKSTLENHHLLQAMSVLSLPECDVLEGLDDDQVGTLSHYIRDLILATDLSLHDMLKKDLNSRKKKVLKAFQNSKRSVLEPADMTSFICCVIKASDLSNEIRPKEISNKWAMRINKEFFAQVKTEKELNLPVTGFMDPTKIVIAKEQINFINNLCLPLYQALVGVNPGMQPCIDQMMSNLSEWEHRAGTWCDAKVVSSIWQETQEVNDKKKSLSDALGGRSNVPAPAPNARRKSQAVKPLPDPAKKD